VRRSKTGAKKTLPAYSRPSSRLEKIYCACAWLLCVLPSKAGLVSTFSAGDSSWHLGTIALAKLDSAPGLAIIVPYRDSTGSWFLDAFRSDGRRLTGFPYAAGGEEINVSPTIYDLDQDGRDEIIFTRGNHVIALRGDGSVMWSNTVEAANYVPTGGYQTVTNGFYWSSDGSFLAHLPSSAVFSSQVSPPIVMDLNGNGTNEIITGWKIRPDPNGGAQDFNPFINDTYGSGEWGTVGEVWSGGVVVFDAKTGSQKFVYHMHQLLESGLAIGRPAANRPLHIYALNDSDSVVAFDKTQPFGLWGKGMLWKQFGKNQRVMSGSYQLPIDIYTADLTGDGLDEVLVAGSELSTLWQPNETILDSDGAILWRRWLPHIDFVNQQGWNNSSCLIPVNPDHDNHIDVLGFNDSYEITFRYWNGVELVDRPGWPKDFFPFLPTPPLVADVDGDGAEEIIIGTYSPTLVPSAGNLLIYSLDGSLKQTVPVVGGIKQIPAVGDVEGNGRLDVIYRSTLGQVYVQNFGSTTTNGVSWATHRGNMRRDGNVGKPLYPAGTPMITKKVSGYNRATFSWSNSAPVQYYRIFRAERPSGPFSHFATLTSTATSFTDSAVNPGWQYFYEVRAVNHSATLASAPFAIVPFVNSNLLVNAGFEENDNSHWDKWFTGDIEMTNMFVTTNFPWQGKQSMQVLLTNQGNSRTIGQYNQYGIPDSTLFVTPGAFYSFGGYLRSGGISQPSEHWLEWLSTKTGYDTNDRPSLPWPNYFTPHFIPGTNATSWTYVNRVFQLPSGFPNIEFRHGYSISAPGSGSIFLDNLFFRQIPAPSATNWTTLVSLGSAWRYQADPPPANWFAPAFNDSSWPVAYAKFGAGSVTANVVTTLPQQRPTYYFRKQFVLGSADFEELLLSATCTDDSGTTSYPLRLFLNGAEMTSPLDVTTAQGNEVRYFDLTPFAQMLRPGTNTVAVQIANTWSSWDDVAFDISLKGVSYLPTLPRLRVQVLAGSPQLSVETPINTVWQIQSCDRTSPSVWQLMENFTNTSGGTLTFKDTGQNGRLIPAAAGTRFYRLVAY